MRRAVDHYLEEEETLAKKERRKTKFTITIIIINLILLVLIIVTFTEYLENFLKSLAELLKLLTVGVHFQKNNTISVNLFEKPHVFYYKEYQNNVK